MAVRTNSAEGGTNTTTVTQGVGGNSGGTSGDYFDAVTIGAGSTLTFSSTTPHSGGLCYRMTNASGVQTQLRADETASDRGFMSVYFQAAAQPAVTTQYISMRTSAGVQVAGAQVHSTGRFDAVNAAGTGVLQSSAGLFQANTWYRLELRAIVGTTTSNGTIQFQVFEGDSLTPIHSGSDTAANTGTTNIEQFRFGRITTAADTTTCLFDSLQWWSDTDTPSTFGHPWAIEKITGVSVTKVSASSVSVAWTDVTDAPDGYDVVRAPGTHTNDGDGRTPSDPLYDPLTIAGAVVAVTADAGTPFVDTGLTPGDYTYWLVRTAP